MLFFTLRLMLTVAAALTPFRAVDAVPTATTPRSVGSMFDNPAFTRPPVVQGPHWNATSHPSSPQPGAAAAISAPYWVVYSDAWVSGENGPPTVSTINGFNVFILSFLMTSGAVDQAVEWTSLTASQRSSIKASYSAAGVKLLISAFGSTDAPTSNGADPVATANTMANWVIQYQMDGIDVDYEDFNAINAQNGKAEAWLESFTKQLRVKLPQGQYILTHAPVAPWFSAAKYTTGAYAAVNSAVGNLIDWYNIQFYNQGSSEYTTCSGLLTASSSVWPNTAVFQLAANGVALNKIVIGKPGNSGDATNGYMSPSALATCVQQAKSQGWSAGVMSWEFPDANAAWISTVRSLSWPVSATPTSTKSSSSPTPTGKCGGAAPWSSTTVYVGGDTCTYQGDLWTAQWWTEGDLPGTANNQAYVWTNDGSC